MVTIPPNYGKVPWVLSDWNHLCLSFTERVAIKFVNFERICLYEPCIWHQAREKVVGWVIGSAVFSLSFSSSLARTSC